MRTYRRKLSHTKSAQSGQAIVLIAFAMIVLLGFLVLAIDGSKFYDQRRTAQNAADMAAMAGLHWYYNKTPNTSDQVLIEIQRVAALNGIPDASAGSNITAYWIDKNGHYVNATTNADLGTGEPPAAAKILTGSKPGNAIAIMVRAKIPYATFIGQVIGQANLTAQADGVASQLTTAFTDNNFDPKTSVFLGGDPSCTNTFLVAATKNSNGFDFGDNAYIVGNADQGAGNSNQGLYFKGDGTASFSGSSGDLTAGGGTISQGTWTNPYAPQVFPDFFYITVNGVNHMIDAEDFRPTSDYDSNSTYSKATYTKNYVVQAYMAAGSPLDYVDGGGKTHHYYHFIAGTNNDPVNNGTLLAAAMTEDGIYFIDGPVKVTNIWTSGKGLVATGKVELAAGNGKDDQGAANDASGWGWGLSILAGYKSSNPAAKCAQSPVVGTGKNPPANPNFDPSMWTSTEQAGWDGIVYAPYGSVTMATNSNHKPNGPMIALSFTVGDGGNSNSVAFAKCTTCWTRPPTYTFGLNQ